MVIMRTSVYIWFFAFLLTIFVNLSLASEECKREGILYNGLTESVYVYWENDSAGGYITFGDNVPANTNSVTLGSNQQISIWYHPSSIGSLEGTIFISKVGGVEADPNQPNWWKTQWKNAICVELYGEDEVLFPTFGGKKVQISHTFSEENSIVGPNIYIAPISP